MSCTVQTKHTGHTLRPSFFLGGGMFRFCTHTLAVFTLTVCSFIILQTTDAFIAFGTALLLRDGLPDGWMMRDDSIMNGNGLEMISKLRVTRHNVWRCETLLSVEAGTFFAVGR